MAILIDVITLFPQMIETIAALGVTGRAVTRGLLEVRTWNPRDYASGPHRSVDDRPYGGGPGMIMTVEPMRAAIHAARAARGAKVKTLYLSPQGRRLDQSVFNEMAAGVGVLVVSGRYEGIDERLISLEIDEEWSIGDYVVSGGELAAMVLIDAIARLQPGALGDVGSAEQDSFMKGLLDYPHYTRPKMVYGLSVPPVLLQGNHASIKRWRDKQALGRTALRRPDLLARRGMSEEERILLEEFMREQTSKDT
jgi:tRNA (guanine37-N1)-methyltransferase